MANVMKNQIAVEKTEPITSGSVNVYLVQFIFSEEWDSLSKVAVFRSGENVINVLLDEDNSCFIPWELMVEYGASIDFGVYGTIGTDVVLPTVWTSTAIILEGVITGIEQMEPTPGIYQQIMSRVEQLQEEIKEFEKQPGPPGKDGFSPTVLIGRTEDGKGTVVTITDSDGDHQFTIWNGEKGSSAYQIAVENGFVGTEVDWLSSLKGNKGDDGFSPTISIHEIENGHQLIVQNSDGETTFDVMDGKEGPKGKAGDTPYIGENGNWWISDTDTETPAEGKRVELYSLQEIRIGTWLDGKPLYRKVIQTKAPNTINTGVTVCNVADLNVETVSRFHAYLIEPGKSALPVPNYFNGAMTGMAFDNGGIQVYINKDYYKNRDLLIFLEYTKTTD